MKTRGFTLVELLAVIIVLGLLTTIALPQVFTIVESSKKSSFQTSCNKIYKQASMYEVEEEYDGTVTCSIFEFESDRIDSEVDEDENITYEPINKLNIKNNIPNKGTFTICGETRRLVIDNGKYTCVRNKHEIQILNGTVEENDVTEPVISEITITPTVNTITIVVDAEELDSKITKYIYTINDKTYESESNTYIIENLDKLTKYEISVEIVNSSNLKATYTETVTTLDIGKIEFAEARELEEEQPEDIEYALSKTITVTYPKYNKANYYFKSSVSATVASGVVTHTCGIGTEPQSCTSSTITTLEPNTWYKTTTLNPKIKYTVNGILYAFTSDGKNKSDTTSYTITKIDTTAHLQV